MARTLTARISDRLARDIDRISEEEHLDKSTVARRLLESAVREHHVASAVEKHSAGEVTLRQAAEMAGLPLWNFLDELGKRKAIWPFGLEDLEEDLRPVSTKR